jgi:DNA-binding response OmpR family regulator
MQLVFVVENDLELCRTLGHYLGESGYAVDNFFSTAEVIRQAETLRPALIVIDGDLRAGNGFELCRRIRRNSLLGKTPLILLSSENERIVGLEAGADDCITKPFGRGEVMARIDAVLRRYAPPLSRSWEIDKDGVIRLGEIEIDSLGMRLSVAGRDVGATTLEFRLIQHLARNQGRVFTRDELLDAVWGNTEFVTPRSVDTCVRRIRKKMETGASRPIQLRTIRGVGYRLDVSPDKVLSDTQLRTRDSGYTS